MNNPGLIKLINSLRSHDLRLYTNELSRKFKSIALKSKEKVIKVNTFKVETMELDDEAYRMKEFKC